MAHIDKVEGAKRKLIGFVAGERASISKAKALAVGASLVGISGVAKGLIGYDPGPESGGDWEDSIGGWTAHNDGHTHTDTTDTGTHTQGHTEAQDPWDNASNHTEAAWEQEGAYDDYVELGSSHDDTGGDGGSSGNGGTGYTDNGYDDSWTNSWDNESPTLDKVE